MKTILSIDFDIIMAPCINIYNDKVPREDWDKLLNNPLFQMLKIDARHYERLTKMLLQAIKHIDKENIYLIEDHGRILKYLPKDEEIRLINIDHHHDLGYGGNPYEDIGCGNWVYYIKNLKEYIWIHNSDSIFPKFRPNIEIKDFLLRDVELENIAEQADMIFISLSEPWVPPYYRPLYDAWKNILEEYFNYDFIIDYSKADK